MTPLATLATCSSATLGSMPVCCRERSTRHSRLPPTASSTTPSTCSSCTPIGADACPTSCCLCTFFYTISIVFSGFREEHIWFSVFHRPSRSTFTSVQRLTCCLSLITGYMLSNIMFYGVDEGPNTDAQDASSWHLNTCQIIIGQCLLK